MLKDFDMELVLRQNFYDFFAERRYNTDDIQLLHRMKAFDPRTVECFTGYSNNAELSMQSTYGLYATLYI